MIDPYRMVLVNVTATVILFIGIIIYRYIYPKKKLDPLVILALISILPILSLLRAGSYESGDFNIHIYRIMSFYDSLKEGHLMPSWAGELNATYGNPLFIFNYSLPFYAISLLHAIGLTFIASMKIYLGASLFFSGIFMYFFVKELTSNKLAAFTASIFYIFNPYHLIDVHFKATLGESTVFLLAPLTFFFLIKYLNGNKIHYLILTGISTGILFMGHPLVALSIFSILVLFSTYISWLKKDKKRFLLSLSTIFIGSLMSIYLLGSFLIFSPYMFPYPSNSLHFYPFLQLFYSPWRYGLLFQGSHGELALIMGYTQLIVVVFAFIALLLNKIPPKMKVHFMFWLSIFLFYLFILHPASSFIWKFFPILWMLLPTGRLLVAVAFATSMIAGYLALTFSNSNIKRVLIYIFILITLLYTILNWGQRKVIPEINDSFLRKKVWISTYENERIALFLNNKWADPDNFWFSKIPESHLEIIKGNGSVMQIERTSTKHTYIIDAKSPLIVKENTLYFPGWSLTSNNTQIYIYPGEKGIINAKLPKGLQKIELKYNDITLYKISKIISVGIFLTLSIILLILSVRELALKMKKRK